MTSFAFIFGVLPLAIATGAGANSRIAIGTAVIGGMLTATVLAIFYIPLFFVLVRRSVRDGIKVIPRAHPPAAARRRHEARGRLPRAARHRLRDDGAELCRGPTRRSRRRGRPAIPISRQAEVGLPVLTYQQIFQRPAAADADRAGAGQQPRPDGRRRRTSPRRASNIASSAPQQLPDGQRRRRRRRVSGDKDERRQRRLSSRASACRASSSTCSAALRSLTHVQLERYLATEAGARATRLTLVADIASAWLDYAADSSLLLIAAADRGQRAEERAPDPAAARGRHRAAHRPQPGRADPGAGAGRPRAAAHRRRAGRQRAAAAGRRADRPEPAARLDRRGVRQRSRRCPAGLNSYVLLRRPDVRPGRISAARRQCADRRRARGACSRGSR